MFETKCTIESFLVIRKAFVVLITVSIALVIIYRLQWAEKSHRQQESYNALLVCSISTKDLFYVNLVFFYMHLVWKAIYPPSNSRYFRHRHQQCQAPR